MISCSCAVAPLIRCSTGCPVLFELDFEGTAPGCGCPARFHHRRVPSIVFEGAAQNFPEFVGQSSCLRYIAINYFYFRLFGVVKARNPATEDNAMFPKWLSRLLMFLSASAVLAAQNQSQ